MDKKALVKIILFSVFALTAIGIVAFNMSLDTTDEQFLLVSLVFSFIVMFIIMLQDL